MKEFDEAACPELAIDICQLLPVYLRPFSKCHAECARNVLSSAIHPHWTLVLMHPPSTVKNGSETSPRFCQMKNAVDNQERTKELPNMKTTVQVMSDLSRKEPEGPQPRDDRAEIVSELCGTYFHDATNSCQDQVLLRSMPVRVLPSFAVMPIRSDSGHIPTTCEEKVRHLFRPPESPVRGHFRPVFRQA